MRSRVSSIAEGRSANWCKWDQNVSWATYNIQKGNLAQEGQKNLFLVSININRGRQRLQHSKKFTASRYLIGRDIQDYAEAHFEALPFLLLGRKGLG